MSSDELRGSTPVYTAKDVLVRLDAKLDGLDTKVDDVDRNIAILISQDLGKRVADIESWQNRLIGVAQSARILGVIATMLSIAALGVQLAEIIGQ